MAKLKSSDKSKPDNTILVKLVYENLPRLVADASSPFFAEFIQLLNISNGSTDANIVKDGFNQDFNPIVKSQDILTDGGTKYGYYDPDTPNTIYLNRALVNAVNEINDLDSRKFLLGKIIHELLHWAEFKRSEGPRIGSGSIDFGEQMEVFFHGLLAGSQSPNVPESLIDEFQRISKRDWGPQSPVVDGRIDGRESIGSHLTIESGSHLKDALSIERERLEPVLALMPGDESPNPRANRHSTPDYYHSREIGFEPRLFKLNALALKLYCKLNDFSFESSDRVLLGIRGCRVAPENSALSHQPFISEATIGELNQDYETPRCNLGVWNQENDEIALYPGSTVPHRRYLTRQMEQCRGGNIKKTVANQLPTGRYDYKCGTHGGDVWGAFRMEQDVVVMRSCNNLDFEIGDIWHLWRPFDNIHPTFYMSATDFSSAGCQTVVGTFKDDKHLGDWSAFRKSAGLTNRRSCSGAQEAFSYLLVTTRELRLMRYLIDSQRNIIDLDQLVKNALQWRRLRFGSTGIRVKKLQRALEINVDGKFGPKTMMTLIEMQEANGLPNDGICSPSVAEALGLAIWSRQGVSSTTSSTISSAPAAVAVAALNMKLPVFRGNQDQGLIPSVVRLQQMLNRLGYMRVVDGDYGPSTAEAVGWARIKYNQAGSPDIVDIALVEELTKAHPLNARLTTEGATFIGMTEIGSPTYYEKIATFPHYPGESSGLTIGFGYDLRFVSESEFRNDWQSLLEKTVFDHLLLFCGKYGKKAKTAARDLKRNGIKIPFQVAAEVFFDKTLPRATEDAESIYPQLPFLPGLCQATVVSLVNNRGSSLGNGSDDRRREMRQIAYALEDSAAYGEIPTLLISMKRLWPSSEGLRNRREQESLLFQRGLDGNAGY